jgi:hypothetical protein
LVLLNRLLERRTQWVSRRERGSVKKKSHAIWRSVVRKLEPVEEDGEVVGLRWKTPDPSLTSQLAERHNLVDAERTEAYLEACRKAPGASPGTKRKWRKRLGFV